MPRRLFSPPSSHKTLVQKHKKKARRGLNTENTVRASTNQYQGAVYKDVWKYLCAKVPWVLAHDSENQDRKFYNIRQLTYTCYSVHFDLFFT